MCKQTRLSLTIVSLQNDSFAPNKTFFTAIESPKHGEHNNPVFSTPRHTKIDAIRQNRKPTSLNSLHHKLLPRAVQSHEQTQHRLSTDSTQPRLYVSVSTPICVCPHASLCLFLHHSRTCTAHSHRTAHSTLLHASPRRRTCHSPRQGSAR